MNPLHPCTKYGAWVTECDSLDCATRLIPDLWIDGPVVIGKDGQVVDLIDVVMALLNTGRRWATNQATPSMIVEKF